MSRKVAAVHKEISFSKAPLIGSWIADGWFARFHKAKFLKNTGPYEVVMKIPRGFEFANDPIWISEDTSACPSRNEGHSDIKDIQASGNQLTFTNENMEKVDLRYQLNLVDTSSGEAVSIDPILENSGRR